ncbi:MAG: hypothetical protein HRU19_29005 [Pseudobacteriovorax sp.]|nr:hypothetical protein [Pseudobacteriovorax sp.]
MTLSQDVARVIERTERIIQEFFDVEEDVLRLVAEAKTELEQIGEQIKEEVRAERDTFPWRNAAGEGGEDASILFIGDEVEDARNALEFFKFTPVPNGVEISFRTRLPDQDTSLPQLLLTGSVTTEGILEKVREVSGGQGIRGKIVEKAKFYGTVLAGGLNVAAFEPNKGGWANIEIEWGERLSFVGDMGIVGIAVDDFIEGMIKFDIDVTKEFETPSIVIQGRDRRGPRD